PDGSRQVPLDTYEKNLTALVTRLKKTGARLIWATTTPVPEGKQNPLREAADAPKYNAAAKRVMQSNGIGVDDLYELALPRAAEIQLPSNVHFNAAGWDVLGRQASATISAELQHRH